MMAQITLADISQQLQQKEFITVAEPACGGDRDADRHGAHTA
ncbi:MAG: hypothetical protein R2867_02640 [Caldilineaceae bacterium]